MNRILPMVILYEITTSAGFRGPGLRVYARLVKCARSRPATPGELGKEDRNAHLKWAFSEAAALFLRGNPEAQRYKQRW